MFSSTARERIPCVIRQSQGPAMTTIRSAMSVVRLGLAVALVGAETLIATMQPGRTGETTAPPLAVERPAPDADRPAKPVPAQPAHATLPEFLGAVGFGWG